MNKVLNIILILIALTILGLSIWVTNVQNNEIQHTKQSEQSTEPTHEERIEVVGNDKSNSEEVVESEGMEVRKTNREDNSTSGEGEIREDDTRNVIRKAKASWYDRSVCGQRTYGETCKTANGEIFNEEAHTMACSYDFALGDRVELCYLSKCIVARCNDRGGFAKYGRTFDLSRGLFQSFADLGVGVIEVSWTIN